MREGGVPSVMTSGTTEMLRWCADSLVSGSYIRDFLTLSHHNKFTYVC